MLLQVMYALCKRLRCHEPSQYWSSVPCPLTKRCTQVERAQWICAKPAYRCSHVAKMKLCAHVLRHDHYLEPVKQAEALCRTSAAAAGRVQCIRHTRLFASTQCTSPETFRD